MYDRSQSPKMIEERRSENTPNKKKRNLSEVVYCSMLKSFFLICRCFFTTLLCWLYLLIPYYKTKDVLLNPTETSINFFMLFLFSFCERKNLRILSFFSFILNFQTLFPCSIHSTMNGYREKKMNI